MIAQDLLERLRPARVAPRRRARIAARRGHAKLVVALALIGALLLGAWLWLRDSSLVAVDRVAVSGQSGPDAAQIRRALIAEARTMTTLDIRLGDLKMAVAPYPVVKDLRVSTQFPHGMRIDVIEQIPVGAIVVGGRTIAVAGDGTLLHDVVPASSLPAIPLRVPPGGTKVSDPETLSLVTLLAAAPYQMLSHVSQVTTVSGHGLVAVLRNGPSIYFGDSSRLQAKWIAASEVLASSGSAGAVYIDVTDPDRPAAGATAAASTAQSTTATPAQSTTATPAQSTTATPSQPTGQPTGDTPSGGG